MNMATDVMNDHTSFDPQEVVRYAALAEKWWDRTGPFWPLHRLNELRVEYILDIVCRIWRRDPAAAQPLTELRTLDIGCGGGILSEAMATLGAEVHSIDVVDRNIAIARHHALQTGLPIHYQMITAEALARQRLQYDVVLNMEVVEHVTDLPGFVQACAQMVRPGGIMFIATLNRTLLSWLTAIVGAEYVLRWLPKGTHRWRRFPKPAELEALLAREGMQVIARRGVRVNPLTRRMALTRFMGVNYMLVFQRFARGVLILLGIGTRWVTVALLPVLLGATWAHLGNGWVFTAPNGSWEHPAFLTAVTVVQALLGDGLFALSNSIAQQRCDYAVGRRAEPTVSSS